MSFGEHMDMHLFEPIVDKTQQHQYFRNIVSTHDIFAMDVLNDWARGFVDRDRKFVQEFQTSFNSCFWELYLFAVLKKFGMEVDFTKTRPDFRVTTGGVNIEATVASHRRGGIPEHQQDRGLPPRSERF